MQLLAFFFLLWLQLYSVLCYSLNVINPDLLYSIALGIIPVITSTCCKLAEGSKLLPYSLYWHKLCQVLIPQYLLGYLKVYFQNHSPKALLTGISSVAPVTFRSLSLFPPPTLIFSVLLKCSPLLLSFVSAQHLVLASLYFGASPFFQSSVIPHQHLELCVGNLGLLPRAPLFITPSPSALLPDSDTQISTPVTASKPCLAYEPMKSHDFFSSETWLSVYTVWLKSSSMPLFQTFKIYYTACQCCWSSWFFFLDSVFTRQDWDHNTLKAVNN